MTDYRPKAIFLAEGMESINIDRKVPEKYPRP